MRKDEKEIMRIKIVNGYEFRDEFETDYNEKGLEFKIVVKTYKSYIQYKAYIIDKNNEEWYFCERNTMEEVLQKIGKNYDSLKK